MENQTNIMWEIAKYLLDAKKAVDALWYISKNVDALKNLDLHKITENKKREFYINCRIIIDKTFPPKKGERTSAEKKNIIANDSVIKSILKEADQNYAHKDASYKSKPLERWQILLDELMRKLTHLREVCADALPDVVTLNFVPHDKELFRQVHKISPEDEEEIKKARHPDYGKHDHFSDSNSYPILNVLHDIDQLKVEGSLQDPSKYGVIVEAGLNLHEGTQNRQDWCIKVNYLHGTSMWVGINKIKWDRNKPCYCYSGKKYKNCCIDVDK